MSTDTYDLHFELASLRKLRDGILEIAQTPEEMASVSGQIVALTKEIHSLSAACRKHKLQSGETLEKPTAIRLMEAIVETVASELSALPADFSDWPRQFINLGADLESVERLKKLIGETPDRYTILDNIARRVSQLPAELKNEPADSNSD
jgi:hypothetical protein